MFNVSLTPEDISALKFSEASEETIKELLYIAENTPDDLLRGFARVWLQDNAIKLLKKFY